MVAGDVCIDWVSIPVESVVPAGSSQPMNWELRGGRHLFALRGGAWLTADMVEAALGAGSSGVVKPEPEPDLESVPPERIIHSMLTLGGCSRRQDNCDVAHWVVTGHDGYAGPLPGVPPEIKPAERARDHPGVGLVVLDDAGNGFRDAEKAWPQALENGNLPLVLYKVRRPLGQGRLWKRLRDSHLDRTIALLSADELRGEGASVSRRLSWERTATDLVLALASDPRFGGLLSCPFLIVPLGVEGALLARCEGHRVAEAHLWYGPKLTEEELRGGRRGDMTGFGSALAAAVAGALVRGECGPATPPEALAAAVRQGVHDGLRVMDRLLDEGFGPCRDSTGRRRSPEYPLARLFDPAAPARSSPVREVRLPDLPPADQVPKYRAWRILDSGRSAPFSELAAEVARRGAPRVFEDVPVGIFGELQTVDRLEIESYRSVRNLMREFLRIPKPQRPLCLAVFGPPGSGKSFGVSQVALSIATDGLIEKLDFNVSQWDGQQRLVEALHRVRDYSLRGKVPLVFFDEFDAQLGRQPLGWLKFFLAPMQDGVFADGLQTHQVGKAIFVFAGGTAETFADFRKKADTLGDAANLKLPDFLSRLRGHVDIFGFDPPYDTNLIRRALVLRSNLRRKHPALEDATGTVRIDDGVLRAFLHVPQYSHGARSLEAIVDMSNLVGRDFFDPSLLPPRQQLDLHVPGDAFLALVGYRQALGIHLEKIARHIHELYLKAEQESGAAIGSRPALWPWEDLSELYRNSNREQAASYPNLLTAARCDFEVGSPDPDFGLTDGEIEIMARMEHDRWVEERRIKQPDHPDLRPWEKLSLAEKEKDFRAVRAIPEILGSVGLRVKRLP